MSAGNAMTLRRTASIGLLLLLSAAAALLLLTRIPETSIAGQPTDESRPTADAGPAVAPPPAAVQYGTPTVHTDPPDAEAPTTRTAPPGATPLVRVAAAVVNASGAAAPTPSPATTPQPAPAPAPGTAEPPTTTPPATTPPPTTEPPTTTPPPAEPPITLPTEPPITPPTGPLSDLLDLIDRLIRRR